MAAWLSHWLRDIVLIVLFAAFVDLLVPNNALQKYVKITISLMILLTILTPIIGMLRPDLDIREAAFDAMQANPGNMGSLSEVLEAGGQLRLEAESRTARLAEAQIADQIRQQVGRVFPVTVHEVDVRIGPGEAEGTAEIKAVRLELEPLGNEAGMGHEEPPGSGVKAVGPIAPIAPVEPVTVKLTEGDGDGAGKDGVGKDGAGEDAAGAAVAGAGADQAPEASAEEARLAADIAIQVGRWWSLDAARVEVVWQKQATAP